MRERDLERISITLDRELLEDFDAWQRRNHQHNRSEGIRDLIRARLFEDRLDDQETLCVGTVTLVYNHEQRELSDRLVKESHHHHDIVLSAMHVHLTHDFCLETIAVRGRAKLIRSYAETLLGMKGVLHGRLVLTPLSGIVSTNEAAGGPVHHHDHDLDHERDHDHSHDHGHSHDPIHEPSPAKTDDGPPGKGQDHGRRS